MKSSFYKSVVLCLAVAGVFLFADKASAASAQMRVKNNNNPSYSSGSTYASAVRAEPGDTLNFRMFFLGEGAATGFNVVLPNGLSYSGSSTVVSGNAAGASVNGNTIAWTFAPSAVEIITFNATVALGASLSADHSLEVNFTTNGSPASSDAATVTTGPIVTEITPSSGSNTSARAITIIGHGFLGDGDDAVTAVKLSDGTSLDLTGAIITDTSISGPALKILATQAVGSYYVLVTVTADGNELTTNADLTETVQYSVTDGLPPAMQTGSNSYVHSTGILTLNFDETIDVSKTIPSKITIADSLTEGRSITLGNAAVSTTDSAQVLLTLAQTDINTISTWGQTKPTLHVRIAGAGIYDMSDNSLSNQVSHTALDTWTKDTIAPEAALAYAQDSVSKTSVKAGSVTITATFSEALATTPKIAIDQPGETDIPATDMSGSGSVWTYTYTLNADSDGGATITLSNALDYAGNELGVVSGNTFTIDTTAPSPAISNLSTSSLQTNSIKLNWTPPYSAADFSAYKAYYGASENITSSNGTAVSNSDLSAWATNNITISGLTQNTTYYFVIYICDAAGNCSAKSNEISARTSDAGAVIITPSSGSASSGPSAPSVNSSSGQIGQNGGIVSTTLSSGSSASVIVSANTFESATSITVSETTAQEQSNAPLSPSAGSFVGNNIYKIEATSGSTSVTEFSSPITLKFLYTASELGNNNFTTLRIAYFDNQTDEWIALSSDINPDTRVVTALTSHFTLFALISFVNPPEEESTQSEGNITAQDEGQVAGATVGVYPNGTLLKAPGSPAVWHISGDKKHLIKSAAVFESRFNWNDIIELPSSRQIDLYEQGADVKFAAGALVKEISNPSVYRVSAYGGIQPIISELVFLSRGYDFSDVIELEAAFLSDYPEQSYISNASALLTGDLVKLADSSAVYYVENNSARLIPSEKIFEERVFNYNNVRVISQTKFNSLSSGRDMEYPDGTLVKGGLSAVYVISDGRKNPIRSASDFEALLYDWDEIIYVPNALLAQINLGSEIRLVQDIEIAAQ